MYSFIQSQKNQNISIKSHRHLCKYLACVCVCRNWNWKGSSFVTFAAFECLNANWKLIFFLPKLNSFLKVSRFSFHLSHYSHSGHWHLSQNHALYHFTDADASSFHFENSFITHCMVCRWWQKRANQPA